MEIGTLIRMANQIGDYFAAMPDHDEAVEGVVNHIQKFWEPRMRRQLLDFLAQHPDGDAGTCRLHPLVLSSVTDQRSRLMPAQARAA